MYIFSGCVTFFSLEQLNSILQFIRYFIFTFLLKYQLQYTMTSNLHM